MYVSIEFYWCCCCYSKFDNNFGADAAAINIAYYNARFNNVAFSNNTGTAVRVSFIITVPVFCILKCMELSQANCFYCFNC